MNNESNEVLLEKDNDGRLLAVQGVKDGSRILLPINTSSFEKIVSYPRGDDEAGKHLREFLKETPVDRNLLIMKMSLEEIKNVLPQDGNDLTVKNFTPALMSECLLDLHRYVTVPKVEVQPRQEVYHALSEDKIDKERMLQELGVNVDSLRENGDLDRMLNFGRSSLITSYPVLAGVCFPMQVKLSFRERKDGMLAVIPHPIRKEPNLNEYRGYRFTDEDRVNLLTTGNLGHTIEIDSRLLGFKAEVYLSLDRETNELVALSKKSMRIPDTIKEVQLTQEQKSSLESGAPTLISGMKSSTGQTFDAVVQVNAERRCLVFKSPSARQDQKLQITDHLLGKEITDDIKQKWKEGKWVYMENMTSKEGKTFSAYVRPNFEKNKFDFAKTLPETVISAQNLQSRTQQTIAFLNDLEKERDALKATGEDKGPKTAIADERIKEYDRKKKMKL